MAFYGIIRALSWKGRMPIVWAGNRDRYLLRAVILPALGAMDGEEHHVMLRNRDYSLPERPRVEVRAAMLGEFDIEAARKARRKAKASQTKRRRQPVPGELFAGRRA